MTRTEYKPNYAVSPGAVLMDLLEARNISQAELARRCGRPEKTISAIINGNTSILAETAIQFERALGINADIWLNLESKYKIWQQRTYEAKTSEQYTDWVKLFPIKEMTSRKCIPVCENTADKVEALLRYFAVSSVEVFNDNVKKPLAVSLRHSPSHQSDPYALNVWLREGELQMPNKLPEYDKEKFLSSLNEIRGITNSDFAKIRVSIKDICANTGVAFLLVPPFPKVAVSGIARWLGQNKVPLIQLSLRGKCNDLFWFSFFHESAHILKHQRRKIYIDNGREDSACAVEKEADAFAREILIPAKSWHHFLKENAFDRRSITAFAKKVKIHTGIVVGRLQKEGYLAYSQLNDLKQRVDFQN
jgi:HTH-type transcriptional regulator / antitoxin HigA